MLKFLFFALLLALPLPVALATSDAAFAASHEQEADHHHEDGDHHDHLDDHVSEVDGVRAVHAWTRAIHAGQDAFVFVALDNFSDHDIALLGGEFEHARSVELVGFSLQNGEDTYMPIDRMPMRKGTSLDLAPRSLSLRLEAVEEELHKGDVFEMHLLFDFGELPVSVLTEGENATQHSHAGHMH